MMKPYLFSVAVPFSVTLLLFSCAKDPDPLPVPGDTPAAVTALNVPAGFDWRTSADVVCRVDAPAPIRVWASLTPSGEPFAEFMAGPGAGEVTLNVPKAATVLYVGTGAAGVRSEAQAVSLAGGSLSWSVPEAARAASLTRSGAGTRAQDYGVIHYPAGGRGTLLFEDLWPSYGDFDFNDLVADYGIRLYPNNKNMVKHMQIVVRMRAVGGSLPYELHLALTTVRAGEMAGTETLEAVNARGEVSMEQLNPGNPVKEVPVFRFNGLRNNANRLPGAAYINTERGYEMNDDELVEAVFQVTFRNSIEIKDLPFDAFDFFIARSDEPKEIHRGGEVPLLYGQINYHTLRNACPVTDKNAEFYYSNDGLVWALCIPQLIPHAYEKTDFVAAYPNFARWVESGGTACPDWYENENGNREEGNLVSADRYRPSL